MDLSGLLRVVRDQPDYGRLLAAIQEERPAAVPALGLISAARPVITAGLSGDTGRVTVVISPRMDTATNLAEQLLAWAPGLNVLSFPEPNPLFYERGVWGPRTTRSRLQVLATLTGGAPTGTIIVTSARGLMQRTLPLAMLLENSMVIRRGERVPTGQPESLLRAWLNIGYEPVTVVTEPGTFSHRGGILDIFPIAAENPIRIELWGDEIESLRYFHPASQRSLQAVEEEIITPAREALPAAGPQAAARLEAWFAALPTEDGEEGGFGPGRDQAPLAEGRSFEALEFYLPWMVNESVSLLAYLPPDALVLVEDADDLAATVADLEQQALSLRTARVEAGTLPPDMPVPYITWGQLSDELSLAHTLELGGSPAIASAGEQNPFGDLFSPGPRFAGELRHFLDSLREITRGGYERVIVVSRQAERLAELWRERSTGPRPPLQDNLFEPPAPGLPIFVQGALAEGWQLAGQDRTTYLFTDSEIFGWRRPEPRRRRQPRAIAPEDFFADLAPGDYIVHVEYGIGRFQGLEKRMLGGIDREFMVVEYDGANVLYVPFHQADRLMRYVGRDDSPPALSRLGGTDWQRVKERTREAVEEIARDLLELYATRETVTGHAFNLDTAWQHELEASFPYVETDDQLRALSEVKTDMERPRPMDRLICGDVGYGKTEVALRAAFKAVMDGKQVAVLVPTTVLAQQHYETFSRRLAAFPVTVEMLSRFRTRAEQEVIIAGLAEGKVDVVIGTHRLISGDVEIKDLGLLIIDEEQRFGVTHKEHLKKMRTEVDVLTLTATPIPRTLYMSLTGARDISVINTAPEERLPVRTYVGRRDDDLIRQAILREMDRGGQVFYVHNRVQTIYTERKRLERLLPEARFGVAHGQMNENELEEIMHHFAEASVDVLVTTSIIEAGLDFPNANTLIVDRADRFGLAQLYQLRGRVGRSANRAYAYFFHPALSALKPEARARLETIAEHTELGAGMNIAMRDLEIRGAGDLLGMRQSGHIAAVGFHLYTQMLGDAVRRMRAQQEGEVAPQGAGASLLATRRETVTMELPIPTYIPTDYVPDMALRIQLYRRMADLPDAEAINALKAELADRFGPLPPPVENLFYQLRVKQAAVAADVAAIVTEGDQISIRLGGLAHVDRRAMQQRIGNGVRVSRTAVWLPRAMEGWQTALLDVLSQLDTHLAELQAG